MSAAHQEAVKKVGVIGDDVLELRPYTTDMAKPLVDAYIESKTQLNRFMPWANDSEEAALGFIESSIRDHAAGAGISFSIHALKENGTYLGGIGLKNIDPFTPAGEIGYWIRTPHTGQGYATRAMRILLKCCEEQISLKRIAIQAADTNPASNRVIEKSGFTREGLHPRAELCHGTWNNIVSYGLLLDDI